MPTSGEVDNDTRRWDKRLHSERVYEVIDFEVIYDLRLYFRGDVHNDVFDVHNDKNDVHNDAY